jgi:hypothetical protein
VFNAAMRLVPSALAALAAVLGTAAPAAGKVIEVGRADAPASCPGNPCLAVSRTTGYQVKIAGDWAHYTIPADGRIVAWTITLGAPSERQAAFFERNLGGPASARITVLRKGARLFSRVVAQGPLTPLAPYFGQTVQFPLPETLPVRKGYVLALTVPTWAPALTPLSSDGSTWRASRPRRRCSDTGTQTAQDRLRALTRYRCLYKARLTYSATLITTPQPNQPATRGR